MVVVSLMGRLPKSEHFFIVCGWGSVLSLEQLISDFPFPHMYFKL